MKITLLCTCLILLLITFSSCKSYYKVISYPERAHENAMLADSLLKLKRYFILRSGEAVFSMQQPAVNTTENTITFYPGSLPDDHALYLKEGHKVKKIYDKTEKERPVLKEVHFYIVPGTEPGRNRMILPFEKVTRVEVLQKDTERTTKSHVLGALGIVGGIGLFVVVIVSAMVSASFY